VAMLDLNGFHVQIHQMSLRRLKKVELQNPFHPRTTWSTQLFNSPRGKHRTAMSPG
jgi:hypothetical protein